MKTKSKFRRVLHGCIALPALFVCYLLIVDSAHLGFSRFLSMLAIIQARVEPADQAIKVTPADPEAHYTRGLSLVNLERLDEAVDELREATRLRPHHYYEWLDLGVTLDRLGDHSRADAALRTSISLAPAFAQPHWQLGNMLYRAERYPEAFQELRKGATSNPNLTGELIRLAWVPAKGDVPTFLAMVQPNNKRSHFEAALFLATQSKGDDSVGQARAAGEPTNEEEHSFLRETVRQLLSVQQFPAALEIWKLSHPGLAKNVGVGKEQIVNGDFLDPIVRDDPGFGWQLESIPSGSVMTDTYGPVSGSRSLRIEYAGDNTPLAPLVSQVVLVQPKTRYSLAFMAKGENLISGGPPVIAALAMNTSPPRILGESAPLSVGTTEWTAYSCEFTTDDGMTAVFFTIQRHQCSQMPCPIFGRLWLSRFVLTNKG
ncbi:MAG TPA: tetratricopeptide repeat protein [Pyrinomonadaceae bacterium]|nr:tetratricopeptide repeat protein [Pyrinomonadaceae bacterium]